MKAKAVISKSLSLLKFWSLTSGIESYLYCFKQTNDLAPQSLLYKNGEKGPFLQDWEDLMRWTYRDLSAEPEPQCILMRHEPLWYGGLQGSVMPTRTKSQKKKLGSLL